MDRVIDFLHDIIPLLTNEECKKALNVVEELRDIVSYMDYNDWEEYYKSDEYWKDIKEFAEYLNN